MFDEWQRHTATLLVLPTGSGKTVIFSEIIRRSFPLRTMVIAHREELIWQAKDKVTRIAGVTPGIEMGDFHARMAQSDLFTGDKPQVVVATVQTLNSQAGDRKRMGRFKPEEFGRLIIDECHRSVAKTYVAIIDYFKQNPSLRILGVTATPDRSDQLALGKVFDSVAYDYEIYDAIRDGWLVRPDQSTVNIEGLDYSHIRTTAGDLNGGDLAGVMEAEKNLQGVAGAMCKIARDRRTLIFTASVNQAEMLCEIMNRPGNLPGKCAWVCGETNKDERRQLVSDYAAGKWQVMVNCDCFTEGFDDPGVQVIGIAKPTKSRAKYAQMLGRAMRPLPGVVDRLETAPERLGAIQGSNKPYAEVVDFSGNAGQHKLVTCVDILGGKYEDDVVEKARDIIRRKGNAVPVEEALDEAREQKRKDLEERRMKEEQRRARLVANVQFSKKAIDPFDLLDLTPRRDNRYPDSRQLSTAQKNLLLKQGIDPNTMNYSDGKRLLNEMFRRWNGKLATLRQLKVLKKFGYPTKDLTMMQATRLIDQLAANGWKKVEVPSDQTTQGVRQNPVQDRDGHVPF